MPLSPQWVKLKETIDRFDAQLDRAVATDDQKQVHQWSNDVRTAFDALEEDLGEHRRRVHARLFCEVAKEDPAEVERINELKQADEAVEKLLDVFKSQLIALDLHSAGPVEARVENLEMDDGHAQEIADRGKELIQWIHDQEASVTIWFAETFVND
jgi:hypothetical protein